MYAYLNTYIYIYFIIIIINIITVIIIYIYVCVFEQHVWNHQFNDFQPKYGWKLKSRWISPIWDSERPARDSRASPSSAKALEKPMAGCSKLEIKLHSWKYVTNRV